MMTQLPPLEPAVAQWITLIGLPVLGAIAGHLWAKYRARLATLRWSVAYQQLAFAVEDAGWGKVEILYNGAAAQNLYMARVQLQNASSRDLQDLRLTVLTNAESLIMRSGGQIRGSADALPFAAEYNELLQKAAKQQLAQTELKYWAHRTPFVVPVLNRGAFADFSVLISRSDLDRPEVSISGQHAGVRFVHDEPTHEVMGVRQGQATLVGVIAGITAIVVCVRIGMSPAIAAAVAWVVGAVAQHVGAAIVRVWRQILAFAD